MRTDTYQIGTFAFRLTRPEKVKTPSFFEQFRSAVDAEYEYILTLDTDLPQPEGEHIAAFDELEIYQTDSGENRRMFEADPEKADEWKAYSIYQEYAPNRACIRLRRDALSELKTDPFFLSLFAMERHQIDHDSMILHCCYIKWDGKAILFSAPSGTGKSTQGGLWEQYRDAEVINGDKALIRKNEEGVWIADGWPVCGTSGICNVEQVPIGAIVMLSQADENAVEKLGAMQAFTKVFSQVTVNRWNQAFTTRAMDLIEELVQSVPVYHLGCTISEDAVEKLEKAMAVDWK